MTSMTLQTLSIKKLHAHPLNPNVMHEDRRTKLAASIAHTETYQPVLVRPHPEKPDHYQILDEASRVAVLASLCHKTVECVVIVADDAKAELLLASFNSLRGAENPYRRAVLVQRLTDHLPKATLATLLPESEKQLDDLLNLLKTNEKNRQKAIKQMLDKAKQALPVHLSFLLPEAQATRVKAALAHYRQEADKDDAPALLAMANEVIERYGLTVAGESAESAVAMEGQAHGS